MSLILRTWRHQAVYGSVEGMYSRTALTKSLSEQKTLGNALQKIVANQTIVSICIYVYIYICLIAYLSRSICIFVCMYICLSISLSLSVSHLSVYLISSLSVYMYIWCTGDGAVSRHDQGRGSGQGEPREDAHHQGKRER